MPLTPKQYPRFWKYVDKSGECWLWTGRDITPRGYARFSIGPKHRIRLYVHRVSWLIAHGELDDGMVIHHRCGNKTCVNPEHLEALLQKDHMRLHDVHRIGAIERARQMRAATHCQRGHKFTRENTQWRNGWRACRECKRLSRRKGVVEGCR